MANQDILKFIREQLAAGYTEVQVREALKSKGWADADVDAAFSEWKSNPTLPDRKDVGRFVGESWSIYKTLFPQFVQVFLKIAGKFLIIAVPGIILVALGAYLNNSGQMSSETLNGAGVGLAIVYVVVFVYFAVWFQVAMLQVIKNRHQVNEPNQVLDISKPLIGGFFATSLLVGVLTLLWTLLLIIPGIIYGIYYSFAEYIYVDKGVRGMDAIRMSKKYVEGIWWPVVSSMLGLIGVSVLVYIVSSVVAGIFQNVVLDNIVSMAINIFFTPYSLIYMYLIYEKLKEIKPEVQ